MNTPDHSLPQYDTLSIAELEARFEVQVLYLPAHPGEHGRCGA
jgi:hypothetical protein